MYRYAPHLRIGIPTVILVWCTAYLTGKSTYTEFLRSFRDERELFVADFLEHEVDGAFDGTGIASLCRNKTWTKDLVLTCTPVPGGLGEVKNGHLHCIRIAMELGAELILPQIVNEEEARKSAGSSAPKRGSPLDDFFDLDHLNTTLATYCPQMKLHGSLDQFHDVPELGQIHKLSFAAIMPDRVNGTVLAHPRQLPTALADWLEAQSPAKSRKYPFRVHLDTPTFIYPVDNDPPVFARHFGRILRIRPDCRQLAASALFNLAKTYGLAVDPRKGIQSHTFAAVHMPTLVDPKLPPPPYPDYATQGAGYLTLVVKHGVRVLFLAAGTDPADVETFSRRMQDFNVTVVRKKDVLEGADLAALQELNDEQKNLVDYEIMLRAGLVGGNAASSFVWNLAMRRRHAFSPGTESVQRPDFASVQWHDRYSSIFGNALVAEAYELTIWP